jgi:hypothetical protein
VLARAVAARRHSFNEFFQRLEARRTQGGETELDAFLADCDENNPKLIGGKDRFAAG